MSRRVRLSSIALGIACGPILCCWIAVASCFCPTRLHRRRGESEDRKRFERRQAMAPRPLAVRGPERCLTIPVPKEVEVEGRSNGPGRETLHGSEDGGRGLVASVDTTSQHQPVREPSSAKSARGKTLDQLGVEGRGRRADDTSDTTTTTKHKPVDLASCPRSRRGHTLDQSQSRLMQLPYELRQMIFRATIGDSTMHMILKKNKLGHLRCKAPSAVDCPLGYNGSTLSRECCWGTVDSANIWLPLAGDGDEGTDGDLLPLLQSCRQM
jgi:hypothetical protein